jgi:hypothetical protein
MLRVDAKTVTLWARAGKLASIRTHGLPPALQRERGAELPARLAGHPPAPFRQVTLSSRMAEGRQ